MSYTYPPPTYSSHHLRSSPYKNKNSTHTRLSHHDSYKQKQQLSSLPTKIPPLHSRKEEGCRHSHEIRERCVGGGAQLIMISIMAMV